VNSGILKILHTLSAHSSRKKPVAISTLQCQSRKFTPKTGDELHSSGLKHGASSSFLSLSSSGLLTASLSHNCAEHSRFWKHLHWNHLIPSVGPPSQNISWAATSPQHLWLPQRFILQKAEEIKEKRGQSCRLYLGLFTDIQRLTRNKNTARGCFPELPVLFPD